MQIIIQIRRPLSLVISKLNVVRFFVGSETNQVGMGERCLAPTELVFKSFGNVLSKYGTAISPRIAAVFVHGQKGFPEGNSWIVGWSIHGSFIDKASSRPPTVWDFVFLACDGTQLSRDRNHPVRIGHDAWEHHGEIASVGVLEGFVAQESAT